MISWWRIPTLGLLLSSAIGCGNGGHINFRPLPETRVTEKGAPFNLVPASQALAIESGKTVINGYHAKLQLAPQSGTKISAASEYYAKIKFTVRNR